MLPKWKYSNVKYSYIVPSGAGESLIGWSQRMVGCILATKTGDKTVVLARMIANAD